MSSTPINWKRLTAWSRRNGRLLDSATADGMLAIRAWRDGDDEDVSVFVDESNPSYPERDEVDFTGLDEAIADEGV